MQRPRAGWAGASESLPFATLRQMAARPEEKGGWTRKDERRYICRNITCAGKGEDPDGHRHLSGTVEPDRSRFHLAPPQAPDRWEMGRCALRAQLRRLR